MKRMVLWVFLLVLVLCGCSHTRSAETSESDLVVSVSCEQAVEAARLVESGATDTSLLEQADQEFYVNQIYRLEKGLYADMAVWAPGGVDAREIAVIQLSDPDDAESARAVVDALTAYQKSRAGDFFGYEPTQAEMIEAGIVGTGNGYVYLLICGNPSEAENSLRSVLSGQGVAETPTSSPEPAQDFAPFHPPQEFDMSLYDDAPIVAAFQTGDDSGLDEKQIAVLTRCREIFDQVITDDMTDFQKELALHDFVLAQGKYDETHYDPQTPLGQPDNTNPYGLLIQGYGVCLGYAETFRLLMDLAGVECITVIGAAYWSSEDHAWNMVRLEGEWYCVDLTWDDSSPYWYFNVSSDWLRKTNHQWDYGNVPEAVATRFYWNGKGALPS